VLANVSWSAYFEHLGNSGSPAHAFKPACSVL
jgi:hypothetical protein